MIYYPIEPALARGVGRHVQSFRVTPMAEMERFLTDASIVAKTAAAAPAADAWIPGAEYEDLASRPPTERVGNHRAYAGR